MQRWAEGAKGSTFSPGAEGLRALGFHAPQTSEPPANNDGSVPSGLHRSNLAEDQQSCAGFEIKVPNFQFSVPSTRRLCRLSTFVGQLNRGLRSFCVTFYFVKVSGINVADF